MAVYINSRLISRVLNIIHSIVDASFKPASIVASAQTAEQKN